MKELHKRYFKLAIACLFPFFYVNTACTQTTDWLLPILCLHAT